MFECTDLGHHALKGFADPVRAWSVHGLRLVESRFDATHAVRITELIGRDEEMEILQRRWQRVRAGQGQVVLTSGEPGIGKSRLVRALEDGMVNDPHTRLFFQCSPYHTNSALFPMIAQLQRAAKFAPGDDAVTKLDRLEAVLGTLPAATSRKRPRCAHRCCPCRPVIVIHRWRSARRSRSSAPRKF
jgi:hypothetical protein